MKDYSQHGETSIIAEAVACVETRTRQRFPCSVKTLVPKIAVEIGAGDGFHLSNIRGLLDEGWKGLQLDKFAFEPDFVQRCWVTAENVNRELQFRMPAVTAMDEEIGVLSIDIDGNDYWIWKALYNYRPYFVVIEFNPTLEGAQTIFYDPQHCWSGDNYFGASFQAMLLLGRSKGYKAIARTHCNLIFARADIWPDAEPVMMHVVEQCFPATTKSFQQVL